MENTQTKKYVFVRPIMPTDKYQKISAAFRRTTIQAPFSSKKAGGGIVRFITKEEYLQAYPSGTDKEYNEFIETFKVYLDNTAKKLDLNDPYEYIIYKCLLVSPLVSSQDVKKPQATYEIVDEESKAVATVQTINSKVKAFEIASKTKIDEIANKLYLFGIDSTKLSQSQIQAKFLELADTNPSKFVKLLEKSSGIEVLINKAIVHRIIKKSKGSFMFYEVNLGTSVESVVKFFEDPKNTPLLETIEETLNNTLNNAS